jgi:hypothetical protein
MGTRHRGHRGGKEEPPQTDVTTFTVDPNTKFNQNMLSSLGLETRGRINEGVSKSFRTESITKCNNKHSLRSNTKGYGGKTH